MGDDATRYTAEYMAQEHASRVAALESEVKDLRQRNDQKIFAMGVMAHDLRAIKRNWWYRLGRTLGICP